jgi:Zn-dependent protease with chaperone function
VTPKQQLAVVAATLGSIAVWYLTPVSAWITDIIMLQIPIEADKELGLKAKQEFPYPTVYDSHWTPVLRQTGRDLVKTNRKFALRNPDNPTMDLYQWDFGVVRADFVNAFALPGGIVRVTDTLLRQLQPTVGELAALLAHEMGHVVCRHSQARMIQQQLLQYLLQGLLYVDHDDVQETFGEAVGELLTKSAAWLGEQQFSRRDEYQADGVSWDLLADSSNNYNPDSLISILSKLSDMEQQHQEHASTDNSATAIGLSTITAWSRTHPATEDRLAALEAKWEALSSSERRVFSDNPI